VFPLWPFTRLSGIGEPIAQFAQEVELMKTGVILTAAVLGAACLALADPIPPGSNIDVRTDVKIDVRGNGDGRVYPGTVAADVFDNNGRIVIPRGSPSELVVRRTGPNSLVVDLDSITVNGRRYSVDAGPNFEAGRDGVNGRRTAGYAAGGALFGTLLGAIAGGGKGAAIGALAGGATGAGTAIATSGEHVRIPAEAVLSFRLDRPLDVYPDPGSDRGGQHYHPYRDDYYYRNQAPPPPSPQ
jgi:hypothetical protein